jgi:hypothetical protein
VKICGWDGLRRGGTGVVCPLCGHEGHSGARFCEGCGSALPRQCRGCGAELSMGARFCSACGQAVDPSATTAVTVPATGGGVAASGERKQVSVLFADVVGFDGVGRAARSGEAPGGDDRANAGARTHSWA